MKLFKNIYKIVTCILLITVLCFTFTKKVDAKSSTYTPRVQEFRGCWVSVYTGDIPSYQNEEQYKTAFNRILDNMELYGLNTMVYHVRIHNDAMYNSTTCPIRAAWANVDFDEFDPLTWSIEAAHARGIEFHAWLNPYRVKSSGVTSASELDDICATFPSSNPASDPNNLLYTSGGVILDPGLPNVRQFIIDTCMDIVNKYDVDAIHFDDYFYISGCDDTKTRNTYNTTGMSLGNFRRHQVDLLIEGIHNALKAYNDEHHTTVQLGISPSSVYRNGSYSSSMTPTYDANGNLTSPNYSNTSGFAHYDNYLYCDTKNWIDHEWIDYICPQAYHAIGHSSSSFAELDKWWNWVVEYKKVNLVMGCGLYMQVDADTATSGSAYYWKDPAELENQIVDANKYKNVDGMCIYKYSSILSSKTLLASARAALTSYWDKKVPGPVMEQYTSLPEVEPENVKLEGGVLSWDEIDNVRGYIVWQVPTNQTVDITSYDQLYAYVQTTGIEVEDGYNYYVSSVNLANEISAAVSTNPVSPSEKVVNLINTITFPVSNSQQDLINQINTRYNNLSASDKALVSNYYLLQLANEQLATLATMDSDATAFIATLKTDVLSNYLLPLSYNDYTVSWSYQNSSDSALYDLTTGDVKVEYIGTTLVKLNATLTKSGVSCTKEYDLNIGYTKQSEVGLFYRNTPNAMNKAEDTAANASFIGWSGVALKFNMVDQDYVFYQAKYNYHELTSSDIPSNSWSSCGDLYVNKTLSTITATASQWDVNTTSGYGYFIVGTNGKVRVSVAEVQSSDTISLQPGEFLYCVKYLDGLITPTVMKPATNFAVGMSVELVEPEWVDETDATKAQTIIDQINTITFPVTLVQEQNINRCKALYDAATSSVKALVTNVATLNQAVSDLNTLIANNQQILNKRTTAVNTINNYISDLSIYTTNGKAQIQNLLSIFAMLVETKETVAEIDALVLEYEGKLDEVPTAADEDADRIAETRAAAITELTQYIPYPEIYSSEQNVQIQAIISQYTNLINEEELINNVNALLEAAKDLLDEIPTILEEIREDGVEEIEAYYAEIDLTLYSTTNQSKIRSSIYTAKTNVNKATTIQEVNQIIANLKATIEGYKTKAEEQAELQNAKDTALAAINNYCDRECYSEENLELIDSIIERYTALINAETTTTKIESDKYDCLSELREVEQDTMLKARNNAIKVASDYADKLDLSDIGKNHLENELKDFKKEVKKASNEDEIDQLIKDFKDTCDELEQKYPFNEKQNDEPAAPAKQSGCFSTTYIVPYLMLLSLAFIVITKRKY